jgi:hypothetical protein
MVEESFGPDHELAEVQVAAAADARRRLRREVEVTASEATFRGVLSASVEARVPVAVATRHGRLQGTPVVMGADCVQIETLGGQIVTIRLETMVAVEPTDGRTSLASDRADASDLHLVDVVAGHVGTTIAVSLACIGGRTFEGTITACGIDVATLRSGGGASSYVALDSVNEVWSSSEP